VAKSGFITILYAFFTPLICYFLFKKKVSRTFWFYLGVAFIGMLLISELSFSALNYGDFLTLLCAVCSAFHIISISQFSKKHDNGLFNLVQLIFVAMISLPLALYFEGIPQSLTSMSILDNHFAVGGILFMGVFSTSIAFFLQVKSQQKIPAHVAGLVFLLESPLAAILGFVSFNESMSAMAIFGSFLVIFSVGIMPFNLDFSRFQTSVKFSLVRFARVMTMFTFGN
jgi:drug/metabolite transporter (DMT)-like permease